MHKNGESEEQASAVPLEILRAYIAEVGEKYRRETQAKRHEPFVPAELIAYIADTYVNNRQIDARTAEKNGELTSMTARQLLATLRLAQAHAKVHWRDEVTAGDVDEALRLVYMSKASVLESEEPSNRREDVLSVVYAVVRELFVGKGVDVMDVGEVERFVMRKGFSQIQLEVRKGGEMHCRSVFSITRILMCGCSRMIIRDWRLFGVFVGISFL